MTGVLVCLGRRNVLVDYQGRQLGAANAQQAELAI